MANKYTLIVLCKIFLVAICKANSSSVSSLVGMEGMFIVVQKSVNFCHPVEYVALVVGASPSVRYYWATW